MNANELRIGNWFLHTNGNGDFTFQVEEILAKGVNVIYKGGIWLIKYEYIKPISLTPEILQKTGFRYLDNSWFEKGEISINIKDGNICINQNKGQVFLNLNINYVHQLQNIVFALAGEELTIEL